MLSRYIMAAACFTNSHEAVLGRYMGLRTASRAGLRMHLPEVTSKEIHMAHMAAPLSRVWSQRN